MLALTLTLGPNHYALRSGTSARRLEKRIMTALRRGAGVLRLPLANGDHVDAVVSPGLPVFIERRHVTRGATIVEEPPVDWPSFGLDQ
ncbi:hypothetical protein ACFOYW_04795 [Gryllotalpicola reticulitermitis]|uniref:Uncharacterized protein n=1 Tax=Gryllotalpicola reticulitermitis TaxID=1184153 RepID=A0ABV8Q518_9MICO